MKELSGSEFKTIELNALKKLDSICSNEGFTYYLAYGTLLGAVRHGGFIPWDDDVDVWMPRPDYDKFVEYCINNSNLVEPYGIAHFSNNSSYCMAMARFYDQRTYIIEDHVRSCGLGVFIDIYPLDGCGNNRKESLKIFEENKNKRFLVGIGAPAKFEKSKTGGIIWNACKYFCYKYANHIGISNLLKAMDSNAKKHRFNDDEFVAATTWAIYRKGKNAGWRGPTNAVDIFEKEWFSKAVRIKFEDFDASVPWKYDEILLNRYGDYMKLPPINEQKGHHEFKAYIIL